MDTAPTGDGPASGGPASMIKVVPRDGSVKKAVSSLLPLSIRSQTVYSVPVMCRALV